jgi:hypothetical protein
MKTRLTLLLSSIIILTALFFNACNDQSGSNPVQSSSPGFKSGSNTSLENKTGISVSKFIGISATKTNNPPNKPSGPSPANGAISVSLTSALSWSCNDPDGDTLKYNVYLGTNSSAPLAASSLKTTSFKPTNLMPNTNYYWRVVANDSKGGETSSEWFGFSTIKTVTNIPPAKPSNPSPAVGAINVSLTSALSWSCTDPNIGDTLKYNVYLGTNSSAPLAASGLKVPSFHPTNLLPNTNYYWRIVANDGKGGETSSDWFGFSTIKTATNTPPTKPSNPSPAVGATNVSLTSALSWSCTDPNSGDSLKYNVYFGTNSSAPLAASGLKVTSFRPVNMLPNTNYYWKVVANDGKGGETSSDWFGFSTIKSNTPPSKPSNPSPGIGATSVSLTSALSWNCTDPNGDVLKYNVYLGTNSTAPIVASGITVSSYKPTALLPNTNYYWKVVANDSKGGETSSDWFAFSTIKTTTNAPPNKPSTPVPASGATNVSTTSVLSWSCTDPNGDALKYNVYLGTNSAAPIVASSVTGTSYSPTNLLPNTNYYWRVVANDSKGGETSSEWFAFSTIKTTTNAPPNKPSTPVPASGSMSVSTTITLSWSCTDPNGDALKYNVYLGTNSSAPIVATGITGTSYVPTGLQPGVNYYWKVIANDGKGGTTSSEWWGFSTRK